MKPEFHVEIPHYRINEAHDVARKFPGKDPLPLIEGLHTLAHQYSDAPDAKEKLELYLNTWWRP